MPFTDKNRWELLRFLKKGESQRTIAKTMNIPPSVINYHTKKLLKQGLIKEIKTTKYFGPPTKIYSLTNKGETELSLANSTFSEGGEGKPNNITKSPRPQWVLHHVQWKYKILKDQPIYMPMEAPLKNWVKQYDPDWKYCTVEKTTDHVIIHVKELFGNNEWELELRSRKIADTMINLYEGHFGMEFGRPVRIGKPHFVLLEDDKVWEHYKQFAYVQTSSGIMDRTPPKGKEFMSVESASNHINVGDNVVKLMGRVANLEDKTDKTNELLEEIKNAFNKFFESQEYKPLPEKGERKELR